MRYLGGSVDYLLAAMRTAWTSSQDLFVRDKKLYSPNPYHFLSMCKNAVHMQMDYSPIRVSRIREIRVCRSPACGKKG
jgi:hypothetical protein